MKIVALNLEQEFPKGKLAVKDPRLDKLKDIFKSAKKTYPEIEVVAEERLSEADAVVARPEDKLQVIISDIDFIDKRLERSEDEAEKGVLLKVKGILEKEELVTPEMLSGEEKKALQTYPLFCLRSVYLATQEALADKNRLLQDLLIKAGFAQFFTAGDKDCRGWLIRQGANAKEAAGEIHSDIQKGFIRAEVVPTSDIIAAGSFNAVRSQVRLEQKDYIVQDGDWMVFRFNK